MRFGGWKTSQRASCLVGSDSDVRHWGPLPAGPVLPSGPCCFVVARAPFVGRIGGWKTATAKLATSFRGTLAHQRSKCDFDWASAAITIKNFHYRYTKGSNLTLSQGSAARGYARPCRMAILSSP